MKALRYGMSVALVAGFASMAACGGATDGGGDASAGNSAGGASSKAGGPGVAGRSGNTGGRGGASSAGAPGIPGFGGAMNNPACPATAPADATACTLTGMQSTCTYTGTRCSCARARTGGGMLPGGMAGAPAGAAGAGAGTREWQCTATLVCPATKPTVGAACTPADGNCQYSGMGSCSCSQQTSTWSCRGGAGGGTGGAFNGGGGAFSFGGGTNSAGAPGGTTTCPATKPTAGTACTGTDACPYTGGGCACASDKWSCL